MSNFNLAVTSYVLVALWLIPLLVVCAWLAALFAARSSPLTEHRVWITAYLLSLLLPALPTARHLLLTSDRSPFLSSSAAGPDIRVRLLPSSLFSVSPLPVVLSLIVTALWLCTVFFFVLRLVWSFVATTRLLRRTSPLALDAGRAELWETCQRTFSLPPTRLLVSPHIAAPLTASFAHPVLVLPTALAEQGAIMISPPRSPMSAPTYVVMTFTRTCFMNCWGL